MFADNKIRKIQQVDAIYLDFAKAGFNRVNHKLLLKKIHRFGICGTLLSWFDLTGGSPFSGSTLNLSLCYQVCRKDQYGPLLFLIYVNNLPDVATSTSVALFADDTKYYRSIKSMEDGACLQRNLDHINQWCDLWHMDLNQSKCGLLSITRNASPFHYLYKLSDVQVKTMEAQKDLGVLVSRHLKWNSQVLAACSKANRMLGFIRRSAFDTHDQRFRKLLYTSLPRSNLAYCSQVWSPQAVNLILDIVRIQGRATKFILSLLYRSEVRYKQRLLKTGLLPLCYWHELLDLVYVFKFLVSLSDPFISVMNSTRPRSNPGALSLPMVRC